MKRGYNLLVNLLQPINRMSLSFKNSRLVRKLPAGTGFTIFSVTLVSGISAVAWAASQSSGMPVIPAEFSSTHQTDYSGTSHLSPLADDSNSESTGANSSGQNGTTITVNGDTTHVPAGESIDKNVSTANGSVNISVQGSNNSSDDNSNFSTKVKIHSTNKSEGSNANNTQ